MKKAEALSCPEVNGKKPYVVTKCHNITGKYVPIAAVVVALPPKKREAERGGGCNLEGTLWGQVGFGNGIKNRSGSGELSCQFSLSERWTMGPVLRVGAGRFGSESWTEKTGFVGGGIRTRGKDVFGLDEFKLDFPVLGYGWAKGATVDGTVNKPTIGGLDAYFAATLKKSVVLEDTDGSVLVTEFMPFGQFPITKKSGPIFWQGQDVDSDSRHRVAGALLRFGLERNDWDLVPEFTLGGWNTAGIDRPWGGKVEIGLANKTRSVRVSAGVEFPNPHAVIEAEVNFYGPWILQTAKGSSDALMVGATPSCDALGMKDCPKSEKGRLTVAQVAEVPKKSVSSPKVESYKESPTTTVSVQKRWCGNKGSCLAVETVATPENEKIQPVVSDTEFQSKEVAEEKYRSDRWNG